ncbi:hypothetical protein BDW66DRAFT_160961 [Aspergillus desertorum]
MLDGSLQFDRRPGAQSPGRTCQRQNTSNNDLLNRLCRYNRRTPGMRRLSLDAMQRNATVVSVECQEWLRESSAVPLGWCTSPQDKSCAARETDPKETNSPEMDGRSDMGRPEASDHTRLSTNPPDAQHMPRLEDIGRCRSQSTDSGSRRSKIAALSVKLRTRLSYAASRIEKKRLSQSQHQSPTGLPQKNSSTPLGVDTLRRAGQPLLSELGDQLETRSPDGTTVSAPDAPAASSRPPSDCSIRQTLSIPSDMYSKRQPDPQKHYKRDPELQPPPQLSPPAEVDSGRVTGQRGRADPNNPNNPPRCTQFTLHRCGRLQQHLVIDSEVTRVPETPPLHPSNHNSIPFSGLSDNSQSYSMEQDAIETLLFMSSPETSGYHSNSQNSLRNQDVRNIDDSAPQSLQWHGPVADSQFNGRQPGTSGSTVETRAGDEIDLMLDQMSSDSDNDADYAFRPLTRVEATSRANGVMVNSAQYG